MLRYPNARLALFNRLLLTGDCVRAFAETAREFGLKCSDDLCEVERQVGLGACGSITTACKILHETVPESGEGLCHQLLTSVEKYAHDRSLKHCPGTDGAPDPTVSGCGAMSAAVMDLLLQVVVPHLSR